VSPVTLKGKMSTLQSLGLPNSQQLGIFLKQFPDFRTAAEHLADQTLTTRFETLPLEEAVKFDYKKEALLTHAILNIASRPDLVAKAQPDLRNVFFEDFVAVTQGFDDAERYSFFTDTWHGGGVNTQNLTAESRRKLKDTLEFVRRLPTVQAQLKHLVKEHPKLVLYRGVSATTEQEAKTRLMRPSWTGQYAPAVAYAHHWLTGNEQPYVGRIVVDIKAVYCTLFPWETRQYGFFEFLVDTSKIESLDIKPSVFYPSFVNVTFTNANFEKIINDEFLVDYQKLESCGSTPFDSI
jgi:hypothetical protein